MIEVDGADEDVVADVWTVVELWLVVVVIVVVLLDDAEEAVMEV